MNGILNIVKCVAVRRRDFWFIKVVKGAGCVKKDDAMVARGGLGRPWKRHPIYGNVICDIKRFKTRRELRDAVRQYNGVNKGYYKIVGGLH